MSVNLPVVIPNSKTIIEMYTRCEKLETFHVQKTFHVYIVFNVRINVTSITKIGISVRKISEHVGTYFSAVNL